MRFTVEQVFLPSSRDARPAPRPAYHVVEAETVDAALDDFLRSCSATVIGPVQKYPGFHAVATARAADQVFTVNLLPGSDTFRRHV
jgi:hypothetical protein